MKADCSRCANCVGGYCKAFGFKIFKHVRIVDCKAVVVDHTKGGFK